MATKSKTSSSKSPVQKFAHKTVQKSPRKRKQLEYTRFRYSKRIKHPGPRLSSGWRLFWRSFRPLIQNWRLFGGILLVYTVLTIVFVRGFSSTSHLIELKTALDGVFSGTGGQLSTGVTLFGVLLGSNAGTSQVATVYQTMLGILVSLSLIWSLRQVHAEQKKRTTIKDAFYKSTHPLIPFLLVILFIGVQLIPFLLGATIYSIVASNGLAVGLWEQIAWAAVFFLLALWSLYMLASSLFAVIIVTLPGMTPVKALRSARKLVRYRRWTVLRKLIFLPFIILLVLAVIMLPLILWATVLAEWSYFVLSLVALVVVLSYMYTLYRELL